jgi:C1A family cysteine protease
MRIRHVAALVAATATLLTAAPAALAGARDVPRPAPPEQAFVQSFHDPLAAVLGRRPAPVTVKVGEAARARLSARGAVLPATYDLRALGRLTPVRDQGDLGTCWAFANLAAVESRLLPGRQWDLSEDNLVLRSGYGPFPGGAYEWGGWDFMAVAYLTRWAGPVDEKSDEYGDGKTSAAKVLKHVQAAVMLPGRADVADNDLIKQLVVRYGAMSAGMYYAARFDTSVNGLGSRWPVYYSGKVLDDGDDVEDPDEVPENHGVDVVGWDDAFPRTRFAAASGQPPGDGAFLVRNSYGASYGDDGYFWVSYHDRAFAFGPLTSYTRVESTGNFTRNYQYDTLGWTQSLGYADGEAPNEAWGANRFVAKATERIAAAGFYVPAAGAEYEVWAGPSLARLSLRSRGTQALPGFTTVDLATPLSVRKGASFVVAVRMVTADGVEPIAVESRMWEGEAQAWLSRAAAKAGQSYMRNTAAGEWRDLSLDHDTAGVNVCLKAYARK